MGRECQSYTGQSDLQMSSRRRQCAASVRLPPPPTMSGVHPGPRRCTALLISKDETSTATKGDALLQRLPLFLFLTLQPIWWPLVWLPRPLLCLHYLYGQPGSLLPKPQDGDCISFWVPGPPSLGLSRHPTCFSLMCPTLGLGLLTFISGADMSRPTASVRTPGLRGKSRKNSVLRERRTVVWRWDGVAGCLPTGLKVPLSLKSSFPLTKTQLSIYLDITCDPYQFTSGHLWLVCSECFQSRTAWQSHLGLTARLP